MPSRRESGSCSQGTTVASLKLHALQGPKQATPARPQCLFALTWPDSNKYANSTPSLPSPISRGKLGKVSSLGPLAPYCITKAEAQRNFLKSPLCLLTPTHPSGLTQSPQPHRDTTLTSFPQAGWGTPLCNSDSNRSLRACSYNFQSLCVSYLTAFYNSPLRKGSLPLFPQRVIENLSNLHK